MTEAAWDYLLAPSEQAIADWLAAAPTAGVVAFVAEADAACVPALQQACRQAGVPLIGALFPELIVASRFERRGLLLARLEAPLPYRLVTGLRDDLDALSLAAASLTEFIDQQGPVRGRHTLFLLFDAMVPNIASLIEAVYDLVGDQVRYAGASAGSETFRPMPCLFDADRLVGEAVLAVWLPDHPGAVLEHGYEGQGEVVMASAVAGNRIEHIAWRPAFAVYQALAREHLGIEVNRDNFYEVAVHFPLGLVRADGQVLVRIPVALAGEAVVCVGEIPKNALLTMLVAIRPDSEQTVQAIAAGLAQMGAAASLIFYCAGRRMHLGAAATTELARLEAALGRPLHGALSLGEIGHSRQGGYPLFHNATVVALPWPEGSGTAQAAEAKTR